MGDSAQGSFDAFQGVQSNGQLILGDGFTVGLGEGAGATDTVTDTQVTPLGRL